MPQGWTFFIVSVVLLGTLAVQPAAAENAAACAGLEPGPTRTVARIVDGETVALDDGAELRLIGTLAPRASDADAEPGGWPMETAATEALRRLLLGKTIEVRFAAGERTDRYGRLQGHAFLIEPDGRRRWVQRDLVESGLARAYASAGIRACGAELLSVEHAARAAPRGLWAEAAYRARQADQPAELLRYRTTFQVIEGSIVRVAQVRGTIYLNFDRNWRQGFSVSLRRDDSALLGPFADDPKGLEGRPVRVRGWIEQRGGAPAINLSDAGLIEVVTAAERQPEPAR
jgi:endonuclease YncB( thermonuclease family)